MRKLGTHVALKRLPLRLGRARSMARGVSHNASTDNLWAQVRS